MENGDSPKDGPRRKLLNCIVDDTALVAGTKKSTRDGFRKWVANGAVRLLVPLSSLSQVDGLKNGHARINSDARDVLQWLDDVTSIPDQPVRLQGMDELYTTWDEVQSFMLPQTLLSEKEGSEVDSLVDDMDNSSDRASLSSTGSSELAPKTPSSPRSAYSAVTPETSRATLALERSPQPINGSMQQENMTSKRDLRVPSHLQPLFNHTLWLIHHVDASEGSFVFVSNDDRKQAIAQRFGIRTKRIEQLREIIAREERDFRNRSNAYQKAKATISTPVQTTPTEDSDDEVVFKRAPRTTQAKGGASPVAASIHVPAPVAPTAPAAHRIYDPNSFGRGAHGPGNRGGRGRGLRGGVTAARGNYGPAPAPIRQQVAHDPNKPIDPDSYARPPPSVRTLRAGKHRLWNPT